MTTKAPSAKAPHTLARRLALTLAALLLLVAALAVASTFALRSIDRTLNDALRQYDHLRLYFDIGVDITRARTLVSLGSRYRRQAQLRTQAAVIRIQNSSDPPADGDAIIATLLEAEEMLEALERNGNLYPIMAKLDTAVNQISQQIQNTTESIAVIEAARQRQAQRGLLIVVIGAVLAVAAVAILGFLLYRKIMDPLRQLQRGVERVRGGALDHRLEPTGDRELVELAQRFNDMTAELESFYHDLEEKVRTQSQQLAQSERLASVGHLAAGVAHEINNPLGIIVGEVELAKHRAGASDQELLERIMEQAMRCKRMTRRLLSLATVKSGLHEEVAVLDFVAMQIERAQTLPQAEGKRLSLDAERIVKSTSVNTDPDLAGQVLSNLLSNACEASSEGDSIVVEVRESATEVSMAVVDEGRGLSEAERAKVFEPFYTSKRGVASGGSGLGLAISYAIVETLQGRLSVTSDGPGKGCRFELSLPKYQSIK